MFVNLKDFFPVKKVTVLLKYIKDNAASSRVGDIVQFTKTHNLNIGLVYKQPHKTGKLFSHVTAAVNIARYILTFIFAHYFVYAKFGGQVAVGYTMYFTE